MLAGQPAVNNEMNNTSRGSFLGTTPFLLIWLGIIVLALPPVRRGFLDFGLRWLYVFCVSLALSYGLTPLFVRLARKYNVMDQPSSRKVHTTATPLLGGAAVFFAFLFAVLLNGMLSVKLGAILVTASVMFVIGIMDDLRDTSAAGKLAVQILCSVLVMSTGVVLTVVPDSLGWFAVTSNVVLTLLWIVGITNAMNFFDGMDGLATGLGAIIAFFLGVVAFQTGQPFLGWVAVAMLGSCIGFLPFNFRVRGRARIFLGDGGSTVVGFILACIAVYGDWSETSSIVALSSPLLIFWILIFDMVHITLERILSGKVKNLRQWIEYTGKDHLHHRIGYALGGQKRSVLFIYLLAGCLGLSAILLRNADTVDALILLAQAVVVVILITFLERHGRYLARKDGQAGLPGQHACRKDANRNSETASVQFHNIEG